MVGTHIACWTWRVGSDCLDGVRKSSGMKGNVLRLAFRHPLTGKDL